MSFTKQVREFKANFWIVNVMEMLERLAYFSVRAVLPLWMVMTADKHGLALSFTEKGIIFAVWAAFQSFIPLFSGAFTDSFGYKKSLVIAFTLNITGYLMMANAHGFFTMLAAAIVVGTGTAIFKPPVQGTVASSVTEENSSLGFGLFYWIVNIGGFLAPLMASALRGNAEDGYTWHLVFYGAAFITLVNFIPALIFYQEPEKSGEKPSIKTVWNNITTALSDFDFMIFLLIFSGFWLMFMQLWDLLPNFIDQWIDSRHLASLLPTALTDHGNVKAEQLININAFSIITFMVPWSILTGKFPRLVAITVGVLMTTFAFLGSGLFMSGTIVALMIVLFSFGEMTCSPKFSEYIGVNAPADKKALYMGLSNIPFAFGWIVGNVISGPLYDKFGNKLLFARKYLIEHKGYTVQKLQAVVNKYVEANPEKLSPETLKGITVDKFDFTQHIEKIMHLDSYAVNKILWDIYHPWVVWIILSSFGFLTIISMALFSLHKRKKATNAQVGL